MNLKGFHQYPIVSRVFTFKFFSGIVIGLMSLQDEATGSRTLDGDTF